MRFRRFADQPVEWPQWLQEEGMLQICGEAGGVLGEEGGRGGGKWLQPLMLLDAGEPGRGRVELQEWLEWLWLLGDLLKERGRCVREERWQEAEEEQRGRRGGATSPPYEELRRKQQEQQGPPQNGGGGSPPKR